MDRGMRTKAGTRQRFVLFQVSPASPALLLGMVEREGELVARQCLCLGAAAREFSQRGSRCCETIRAT